VVWGGFILPTCDLKNTLNSHLVRACSICLPIILKVTLYPPLIWGGLTFIMCHFQKLDKMPKY
jgi:hypothetical protein